MSHIRKVSLFGNEDMEAYKGWKGWSQDLSQDQSDSKSTSFHYASHFLCGECVREPAHLRELECSQGMVSPQGPLLWLHGVGGRARSICMNEQEAHLCRGSACTGSECVQGPCVSMVCACVGSKHVQGLSMCRV